MIIAILIIIWALSIYGLWRLVFKGKNEVTLDEVAFSIISIPFAPLSLLIVVLCLKGQSVVWRRRK